MSWLGRSMAVARHETRMLRKDSWPVMILFGMPIVISIFMQPAMAKVLEGTGHQGVNGTEQSVPGMTLTFAFFLVGFVGWSFFNEHAWETWPRVTASPARMGEIVVGKLIPAYGLAMTQFTVMFTLGWLLFDLRIRGSILALVLLFAATALFLVAFGMMLAAWCRTARQLDAVDSLGGMFFAGAGGALVPFDVLPGYVQAIAPFTPGYWAMQGFQKVILDGATLGDVFWNIVLMVAFALGALLWGISKISAVESKVT
ncbi:MULTISPECIES: ABC transporter permease [Streptomyces]|uniref:ABC transporter permease n=1 Tax=Streptomyces TaxID=1883 RepID=UPI00368B9435